jgi:hypothetical protein
MAELGDKAPLVWSVPVANVDGVVEGDYGKDPFPWDLNRAWLRVPMRHEVQEILRDMRLWRSRCAPKLAIDFHSPGGSECRGVYTFMQSEAGWYKRQEPWVDAIREALGDFASPDFKLIPNYPGRFDDSGKFTSAFCRQFDIPALVFETPYSRIRDHILSLDDYLDIGARIADGVIAGLSRQGGKG